MASGVVLMGHVLSGGHFLRVVPLTGLRRVMAGVERRARVTGMMSVMPAAKDIVSHACLTGPCSGRSLEHELWTPETGMIDGFIDSFRNVEIGK